MNKDAKATIDALAELGYDEVGHARNGHYIMEHPYAGRLQISLTPSGQSEHKQALSRARRKIGALNNDVGSVIEYLRHKYNVADNDSVVVAMSLAAEVRKWGDHNQVRVPNGLYGAVRHSDYLKMLKAGQKDTPSQIQIYGKHFVPEENGTVVDHKTLDELDAALATAPDFVKVCESPHPTLPGVWCTHSPGHEGQHGSEAVEQGWNDPVPGDDVPDIAPPQFANLKGDVAEATLAAESRMREATLALVSAHAPELLQHDNELRDVRAKVADLREWIDGLSELLTELEKVIGN